MIELLKYSDTVGPYFFMVFVVAIITCAVWLIAELKRTSSKAQWPAKAPRADIRKIIVH